MLQKQFRFCNFTEIYLAEAIQRSAFIAEAEDGTVIEPTHLERVLPQLLLDF
jgi:centromere protein X